MDSKKNLSFAFYGNHYDIVIPKKEFDHQVFCQRLVYGLVENVTGIKSNNWEYRNIGWNLWTNSLKNQEKSDQNFAKKKLVIMHNPIINL